jgi:hypothetical protein
MTADPLFHITALDALQDLDKENGSIPASHRK